MTVIFYIEPFLPTCLVFALELFVHTWNIPHKMHCCLTYSAMSYMLM